ncbi:MAG: GAP family protein [Actinomycetes bacterium]
MGVIILLAIGSAVFPMLLAGVAVLLSRSKPAKLMMAFWLGGFTTSFVLGIVIINTFGEAAASLGSEGKKLSPTVTLLAGVLALLLAWLLGTNRGHELIESWRVRRPRRKNHKEQPDREPWAERVLDRSSIGVAALAGAILNLPGPFYLLALGHMAADHYSQAGEIAAILLFNLIMLILVEAPIIGYLFDPARTDKMVSALSAWLNRNGMRIIALLAAVWGISLIGKSLHDILA